MSHESWSTGRAGRHGPRAVGSGAGERADVGVSKKKKRADVGSDAVVLRREVPFTVAILVTIAILCLKSEMK